MDFAPEFESPPELKSERPFHVAAVHQEPFDEALEEPYRAETVAQRRDFVHRKQLQVAPYKPAMKSAASSLYQPLLDASHIRLLEIYPGSFDADIRGTLHSVSIEFKYTAYQCDPAICQKTIHAVDLFTGDPVCYTALSYVWGEQLFDCSLDISGLKKMVTRNVDSAIRHLRHSEHSVNLWIDQVCIDQDDLRDKESQIQLMSSIYSRAWNTVLWLGPQEENGAFEALHGLSRATKFLEHDFFDDELDYLRHPLNEAPEVFEALISLFKSPWFRRTWTIQEVILSETAYVMAGLSTSPWEEFAGYCVAISRLGIFDPYFNSGRGSTQNSSAAIQLTTVNPPLVVAQLWQLRTYYHLGDTKADILSTLVETRHGEASDPRDKIYGVLGICKHQIFPDYRLTFSALFTNVAVDSIREACEYAYRPLKAPVDLRFSYHSIHKILLCVDHDVEESLEKGLPSWVPDWSRPRATTSLGFTGSAINCYGAGGVEGRDAVLLATDCRSLELRVIFYSPIHAISRVLSDANLTADSPQDNESLKASIDFVSNTQSDGISLQCKFIPFCYTLVAGKDGSGQSPYSHEYTEIFSLLCDEVSGTTPTFADQIYSPRQQKGHFSLASLKTRKPGRAFQGLKKAHVNVVLNRRLCWLNNGSLGLVPHSARVGDWIMILLGCVVPFVFRKTDAGEWLLVGECYVFDIMNGELTQLEGMESETIRVV